MTTSQTGQNVQSVQLPPAGRGLILAIAVACGAAVMEVEILGARIVSPFFGVSLFVWTALITVTLLSLAAGYYLGGRLADKRGSLRLLSLLVGGAGLWLFVVPLLRGPVLRGASGLGVRTGALAAAMVLFGPALILLGTVTPMAVRLFLSQMDSAGRTVGRLSALGTLGSFAGTVATGFWLVPRFHVDQIAYGTAAALLLLAAGGLVSVRKWPWTLALPVLPLLFLGEPPKAVVTMPTGTRAEVVCRRGSFYGDVRVVEYSYGSRRTREMVVGGVVQGGIDVETGEPIYEFSYALERAVLAHDPSARRALVIGLGPGNVPSRLARYGMSGAVVEIDPAVVEVAKSHFGFRDTAFPVRVEDGRVYLERAGEAFDAVLLDAFSAESEPTFLLTREAFRAAHRRLTPGGVLAINISGLSPGPGVENRALDGVLRAMAEVFPAWSAYPLQSASPGQIINYTLVGVKPGGPAAGSQRPPAFLPIQAMAREGMQGFMERTYAPPPGDEVYVDDWAPFDAHNALVKLRWRQGVLESTPFAILLD